MSYVTGRLAARSQRAHVMLIAASSRRDICLDQISKSNRHQYHCLGCWISVPRRRDVAYVDQVCFRLCRSPTSSSSVFKHTTNSQLQVDNTSALGCEHTIIIIYGTERQKIVKNARWTAARWTVAELLAAVDAAAAEWCRVRRLREPDPAWSRQLWLDPA